MQACRAILNRIKSMPCGPGQQGTFRPKKKEKLEAEAHMVHSIRADRQTGKHTDWYEYPIVAVDNHNCN